MMAETVTPDTFNPPHHELSKTNQHGLDTLLQEYESQFAKDETSIRTTPLTSMTIGTGASDPHLSKTLPHCHEPLSMGERRNRKTTSSKSLHSNRSIWSAPIIVVPKGDGGKHLVIDYRALNKVTRKFTWAHAKGRRHFFPN